MCSLVAFSLFLYGSLIICHRLHNIICRLVGVNVCSTGLTTLTSFTIIKEKENSKCFTLCRNKKVEIAQRTLISTVHINVKIETLDFCFMISSFAIVSFVQLAICNLFQHCLHTCKGLEVCATPESERERKPQKLAE